MTCIDAATPLIILRASDLGKTGHETPDELDADRNFLQRLEAIRLNAALRMGLPPGLVLPKPVLVALPRHGGTIAARYFMPHACHKALAVTGAVGLATACATPGTVAHDLIGDGLSRAIGIEHPAGRIDLELDRAKGSSAVSLVRTARRIFEGAVFAPVDEGLALAA